MKKERALSIIKITVVALLLLFFILLPFFNTAFTFKVLLIVCCSFLSAIVLLHWLIKKEIFFFCPMAPFIIFPFFGLIGTIAFSHDFLAFAKLLLIIGFLFVLFYTFVIINSTNCILRIIAYSFAFFSVVFLSLYVKTVISDIDNLHLRFGNEFGNQNDIAMYFLIGLICSLYLTFFRSNRIDLLNILLLPFFFFSGFLTGSRMFFAASVFAFVCIIMFKFRSHKWIAVSLVISVLIGSVLLVAFVPLFSTLKDRLISVANALFGKGSYDISLNQRLSWFKYAIYLGSKNMLIGYGFNGFSHAANMASFSHSNISELFCNFGIPGFLLFYYPFFYLTFFGFKKASLGCSYSILPITFSLMYYFISFVAVFYNDKLTYTILALSFYILFINANKKITYNINKLAKTNISFVFNS